LLSSEAQDGQIKQRAINDGITGQDRLGFCVLQNLPQLIGERQTRNAANLCVKSWVERLFARQCDRLPLIAGIIADDAAWLARYKATNGKPLTARFDKEEVGLLADGHFGTNKIAFTVAKACDRYPHRLSIDRFIAGESRWSGLAAAVR